MGSRISVPFAEESISAEHARTEELSPAQAEDLLIELAANFLSNSAGAPGSAGSVTPDVFEELPDINAVYRALVEQIPAVVFMAHLDRGIGEAYVSPQIEATLGYSQEEWLEDPIRWYQQIHPDDKQRWSVEAAQMFLSGTSLRSAYRVITRDGRVVWFHCEAKMIRRKDGRPWFIHGIAFDITELKQAEQALQEERNVVSAILHTVGALVVVLDAQGKIRRFNRACELVSGYSFAEMEGKYLWELCVTAEDTERLRAAVEEWLKGKSGKDHENEIAARDGSRHMVAWSCTILPPEHGGPASLIVTGMDITERKRLEQAIHEISSEEQRRIGQDLHDGLGQHLTGIAFMSKVQEQKLADKGLPEAADAARIVRLVNEAINRTRELAHGLIPVFSDAQGLMSALRRWMAEVEDLFKISCRFDCDEPVLVHDTDMATHLYRIAQEAVNNAIKHGDAKNIVVSLSAQNSRGTLRIDDDGPGISEIPANNPGMGMQIMNYRAKMIGGSLRLQKAGSRGTSVICQFPLKRFEVVEEVRRDE
jgi:PAS domain S-box-containing protein